jgi:hypothetical protein
MKKETNMFSNIKTFEKKFSKLKNDDRINALEVYFNANGVIRAYPSEKDWPKLTYPSCFVLEKKLSELKNKKSLFEKNLRSWEKKYSDAENYHKNNQIKKLKEPLFWKHQMKMLVDADYRNDVAQVKLPVHLVSDNKWKPMVKMFVTDLEYRKQLTETVRESIIYKKDKKVAKYADELKDFRMKTSDKQVKDLEKKIEKIDLLEKALKELLKWSKE